MNKYEKNEIRNLPSKYRPMGAWGYFGYGILFAIPIIGQIAWLICALSSSNISRRSFARSYFCKWLVAIVIVGILVGVTIALIGMENLSSTEAFTEWLMSQEWLQGILENFMPQG